MHEVSSDEWNQPRRQRKAHGLRQIGLALLPAQLRIRHRGQTEGTAQRRPMVLPQHIQITLALHHRIPADQPIGRRPFGEQRQPRIVPTDKTCRSLPAHGEPQTDTQPADRIDPGTPTQRLVCRQRIQLPALHLAIQIVT